MKIRKLYPLLALEAALCAGWQALAAICGGWAEGAPVSLLARLGQGLRALSLSGTAGDLLAWVLYLALGLAPAAYGLVRLRQGRALAVDGLLPLLSAVLLAVLYGMVNPSLLAGWFLQGVPEGTAQALAGGTVWILLAVYLVLRVLRAALQGSQAQLQCWLGWGLAVLDVCFVAAVFGAGLGSLTGSIVALRAANTAVSAQALRLTEAMLALGWLVDSLPALLGIRVVHGAAALLDAARTDRYSDQTVAAAQGLARCCGAAAAASLLAQAGYALAQLLLAGRLYQINTGLQIDLDAILLLLAALVLARWLAEGQAIRAENERFI